MLEAVANIVVVIVTISLFGVLPILVGCYIIYLLIRLLKAAINKLEQDTNKEAEFKWEEPQ